MIFMGSSVRLCRQAREFSQSRTLLNMKKPYKKKVSTAQRLQVGPHDYQSVFPKGIGVTKAPKP